MESLDSKGDTITMPKCKCKLCPNTNWPVKKQPKEESEIKSLLTEVDERIKISLDIQPDRNSSSNILTSGNEMRNHLSKVRQDLSELKTNISETRQEFASTKKPLMEMVDRLELPKPISSSTKLATSSSQSKLTPISTSSFGE